MQNKHVFSHAEPGGGIAGQSVGRQARDLASDAKEGARAAAEEGREKGADRLKGVADTVDRVADEVAQESPAMADWVRAAAGQIDDVSRTLKEKSVSDLLTMGRDFARREPAAFIAASAFAGFALSRLLKSSAPSSAVGLNAPPVPAHPAGDTSANNTGMSFHPGDAVRPTPSRATAASPTPTAPGVSAAGEDRQPEQKPAAVVRDKTEGGQSI